MGDLIKAGLWKNLAQNFKIREVYGFFHPKKAQEGLAKWKEKGVEEK